MARRGRRKQRTFDDEYNIKAIVGETEAHYQVVWEDTWIPKDWVTARAIDLWEERKADIEQALSSPLSEVPTCCSERLSITVTQPDTRSSSVASTLSQTRSQDDGTDKATQPLYRARPQTLVISSSDHSVTIEAEPKPATRPYLEGSQPHIPDHQTPSQTLDDSGLLSQSYDLHNESFHHIAATPFPYTPRPVSHFTSSQVIPDSLDSTLLTTEMAGPASVIGLQDGILPDAPSTASAVDSSEVLPDAQPTQNTVARPEKDAVRSDGDPVAGNYVLLPMTPTQRQQYKVLPDLPAFRDMDFANAEQGEKLLPRLRTIAIHPDLDAADAYTQYDVEPETHVSWDTAASSKFAFMEQLFKRPGHYGIVARDLKMRALCKNFIDGLGYAGVTATTRVSLLDVESSVDLVIDLDGSATPWQQNDKHIRLIASYTIEHFELGLHLPIDTKIATLVTATEKYGSLAGVDGSIDEAVQSVTAYLERTPLPVVRRVNLAVVEGFRPPPAKKIKLDSAPILQEQLLQMERRADQWECDYERLLEDHMTQGRELRHAQSTREAAEKSLEQAAERSRNHQRNIVKYRGEITDLKDRLRRAEAALLDHTVPARAELESMRQAADKAKQTAESADGRLKNAKKDLEYAQDMYRNASNQAVALAHENGQLTKKLATAESAADAETAKILQISVDKQTLMVHEDNKQLRALIKQQAEELKALKRG